MTNMTQKQADEYFSKVKEEWDRLVEESGKTAQMYIATDGTGEASRFLMMNEYARQEVESRGLVWPELVPNLKTTISEA